MQIPAVLSHYLQFRNSRFMWRGDQTASGLEPRADIFKDFVPTRSLRSSHFNSKRVSTKNRGVRKACLRGQRSARPRSPLATDQFQQKPAEGYVRHRSAEVTKVLEAWPVSPAACASLEVRQSNQARAHVRRNHARADRILLLPSREPIQSSIEQLAGHVQQDKDEVRREVHLGLPQLSLQATSCCRR